MARYLIIGGGRAGAYAAQAIRQRDLEGPVTIVGAEPELPYNRPPLSKEFVRGEKARAKVFIKDQAFYDSHQIRVITGRRATGLDRQAKAVYLDDGRTLVYDKLLLATGGEPRRARFPGADLAGIYYLRTLSQSEAIQAAMAHARTAVVIGGGFIGCEVAASLTQKGIAVTMLFPESVLLEKQLGAPAGRFLTGYFRARGVTIVAGALAAAFVGDGAQRLRAVRAESGEEYPCEMTVVGIGIHRNTALAQSAGLRVDDGILVDEYLQTGDPDIYAAGDVAAFYDRRYERVMRIEHWDNASAQGRAAGARMAGGAEPFEHVHYFFSDMFDLSFNAYGDMYEWNEVVERVPADGGAAGRGYFYLQDGRLKASLLINAPHGADEAQRALARAAPVLSAAGKARCADPAVPLEALR